MVEHPLSKRKVGSSILPGGNLLAPQTTKRTSRSFVSIGLYTALLCRTDERVDTVVCLHASFTVLLSLPYRHHGPVSGSLTASRIAGQPGGLFPSFQRESTHLVARYTPAEFHRPGRRIALSFLFLIGASGQRAVYGMLVKAAVD